MIFELIVGGAILGGAVGAVVYFRNKKKEEVPEFNERHGYYPAPTELAPRARYPEARTIYPGTNVPVSFSDKPRNPWMNHSKNVQNYPSTMYQGERYYRDDQGRFYNSGGSPVTNMVIGAALGGLAGYAFSRALAPSGGHEGGRTLGYSDGYDNTGRASLDYNDIPNVATMGGNGTSPVEAVTPVEFSKPRPVIEEDVVRDSDISYGRITEDRYSGNATVQEDRYPASAQVQEERYEERANVVEDSYSPSDSVSEDTSSES